MLVKAAARFDVIDGARNTPIDLAKLITDDAMYMFLAAFNAPDRAEVFPLLFCAFLFCIFKIKHYLFSDLS